MKLQKQSGHHCLIYALAMALDIDANTILEMLGHDGTDIWWPEKTEPLNFRGVHIQECIDVATKMGHGLMPIEFCPMITPDMKVAPKQIWNDTECNVRFQNYLTGNIGVLIGERATPKGNFGHAVGWDGENIYDPIGQIYGLDNEHFYIREFWMLT